MTPLHLQYAEAIASDLLRDGYPTSAKVVRELIKENETLRANPVAAEPTEVRCWNDLREESDKWIRLYALAINKVETQDAEIQRLTTSLSAAQDLIQHWKEKAQPHLRVVRVPTEHDDEFRATEDLDRLEQLDAELTQ